MSKVGVPGSARDAAEERPPVNKKVKMSATTTSRGDENGPLFLGESRGSGAAPAIASGKRKATQTMAQQNVGYLGTILSPLSYIESLVMEINIFISNLTISSVDIVCQLLLRAQLANQHLPSKKIPQIFKTSAKLSPSNST